MRAYRVSGAGALLLLVIAIIVIILLVIVVIPVLLIASVIAAVLGVIAFVLRPFLKRKKKKDINVIDVKYKIK